MARSALRRLGITFAAALSLGALGCAGASAAGSTAASTPKGDQKQITAAEMQGLPASNLLQVVQRLHPEWLTQRSSTSIRTKGAASSEQGVQVYIDSQHAGSIDVLGELSVNSASVIKFLSAAEAQSRFGNGNLNGAIQVISVTKR